MSKIEVDAITQQSGTTLTVGGGACKTATVDATTVNLGRSGGTVSLAAGATQSGFGRTGTVDWQTTPKTATFTAVNGEGYFANTTGSAFNMNLPAGSAGAIVSIADYTSTFQTNNLTIVPNGTDKIGGKNLNAPLATNGQSITLVFVDSTEGWVTTADSSQNVVGSDFVIATVSGSGNTLATAPDCADTKIATFTGPGSFIVTDVSPVAANNVVSHLIVAGGGSGGTGCSGGGGGAGGFREVKSPVTPYTASPLDGYPSAPNRITLTAQTYAVVVGGGATGQATGPNGNNTDGTRGSDSSFGGITSTGGGAGGDGPAGPEGPGGSGGGGGHSSGSAGNGNTPPVSPAQGFDGRPSQPGSGPAPSDAGGAGGGATAAGTCGSSGHQGGAGATTSISATPTAYAGGGGGSNRCGGSQPDVAGGAGGGGKGAAGSRPRPAADATGANGTDNTGGGGGAGGSLVSGGNIGGTGSGGSGIVIIRYKFQ